MLARNLLLTLAALAAGAPKPTCGQLPRLPEGPAARALAGLAADTAVASIPHLEALRGPDPWGRHSTWELWADTLVAESRSQQADYDRRALLCRLAHAHGRDADAWGHFALLTGSPEHAAATLPYLFPGIPEELQAQPGGRAPVLPEGVLLRPALPPAPAGGGPLAYREAEISDLRIGATHFSLSLLVENTGVQLDLKGLSGPPAELELLLPEPQDFEIRVEYVDWMRQEQRHAPRRLRIETREEPLSLFGRVLARPLSRPSLPGGEDLPAALAVGGLHLDLPASLPAEERDFYAGLARRLSKLLGISVQSEYGEASGAAAAFPGIHVPMGESGAERALALRYLAHQIESRLLATP